MHKRESVTTMPGELLDCAGLRIGLKTSSGGIFYVDKFSLISLPCPEIVFVISFRRVHNKGREDA